MCILGYGWRRGNRSKDVFAPPPVVSDTACSGPWPVRPRGRTSGERQHCSDPPATAAASTICCSENSVPHTYHSSWTVHPVLLRRPWFLASSSVCLALTMHGLPYHQPNGVTMCTMQKCLQSFATSLWLMTLLNAASKTYRTMQMLPTTEIIGEISSWCQPPTGSRSRHSSRMKWKKTFDHYTFLLKIVIFVGQTICWDILCMVL